MSQEARFQATLVSVGDTILKLNNDKGTPYRICTIKLESGKTVSARMYEGNFAHGVTPGEKYSCTARTYANAEGEEQVDITMSHLTQAPRATMSDLASSGIVFEQVAATAPATSGVLTPETI